MINTCPNCGSAGIMNSSIIYNIIGENNNNYQIRKCNHCFIKYTYYNYDIDIASLYDSGDYKIQDTRNTIFELTQKIEYGRAIIDFGSGKGLFLALAQKCNLKVYGVETSQPRSDYARSTFSLNINTERYRNGNIFGTCVDAITLFHVLEHLPNPQNILFNLIKSNLNKDGIVIIEVPNFSSIQSRIAGNHWMHLDVPRHVLHYDIDTLKALLERLKLKPLKYEGFSMHLGVLGMVQSIMKVMFAYDRSLLTELKYHRSTSLLVMVILILPVAILIELSAAMFLRGGIIRVYAKYNN